MTQLSDIQSVHWQPALYRDGVVEGIDDIDQAIRIILATPTGSVPHRPEFGADLHLFLDYPVDAAIPNLVREAFEAVRRWEPRVTLKSVRAEITGPSARLSLAWALADGIERTSVVPLR